MKQLGIVLPDRLFGFNPVETVRFAKLAEDAGFQSVWKAESSDSNSLILLSAIANETSSVQLGTGVANVFTRSPALLAMSANTLNDLSDGRLILGLGVSSKPVIENWHGLEFERPLRRLRETIEIIKAMFHEETIEYNGDIFDVGPYSTKHLGEGNIPTIFNAALGETNRQLTGEFADGWMPLFVPQSEIETYINQIHTAAKDAGRNEPTIAPWIPAAVDNDPNKAEARIRSMLAQEFAMGYNRIFRDYGYGETADEVHDLWRDGNRDAARETVSDDILDEFTIYGTPNECRNELTKYHDAGVDVPLMWPSFSANKENIEMFIREFGKYTK